MDLDAGSCVGCVMSALGYKHIYSHLEKYISNKTQQQIFLKPLRSGQQSSESDGCFYTIPVWFEGLLPSNCSHIL